MIYNVNVNDPKSAAQSLVTAHNRLEGRVQAVPPNEAEFEPIMRHRWIGVVVDKGPNGEDSPPGGTEYLGSYWVQLHDQYRKISEDEPIVIATNVHEVAGAGAGQIHQRMSVGDWVILFPIVVTTDADTGVQNGWFFSDSNRPNNSDLSDGDRTLVNIGSTGETEAADTAAIPGTFSGTAVPAATDRVKLVFTQCCRVVYKDDGDEKLYAYYRDLTFVNGLLVTITEETRVEVDAPTDCSS